MNKLYVTVLLGIGLSSCSNNDEIAVDKTTIVEAPVEVSNEIPQHKVQFPKTELESFSVQKSMSTPPNMPPVTEWLLEGKDANGPFMYFVTHSKMPKALDDLLQQNPDELGVSLQAMLTGSAEKLGGSDFEYSSTELDKHPGMYSKCKVFNGAGIIKSVAYLVDKDVFIVSGGGRGISEEKLDTFLASFELTE